MAFVFRKERSMVEKVGPVPGPGSYHNQFQRENKIPKAYVPFGSMETRNYTNLKQSNNPGPGSYNLESHNNGEKIIVSSETEDIKILQISRPNPVFKSGVPRFTVENEEKMTPGPGEYELTGKNVIPTRQKAYSMNTNTNNNSNNKPKILEHLMSLNKYQSIPSIPSNTHAYGYNENQLNELELNEPPVDIYKGEKQDKVGPGQYDPAVDTTKPRGISWTQPKSNKVQEVKLNANLGPGSYEARSAQPLYSLKPSSQFTSKTLRMMDQRKGAALQHKLRLTEDDRITEKEIESRVISEKAPPSTHIGESETDSDDDYEYIDDTTPGPGSYLEISEVKKTKARRSNGTFGVISRRFPDYKCPTGKIGPGDYNIVEAKKNRRKKIHSQKDQMRCPSLIEQKKVKEPGPGAYEPRNTMEDKLIYKIQRGYRGQFGSTEVRGREVIDEEMPGPGYYDPEQVIDEKPEFSVFKSNTKRKFIEERKLPAPGDYQLTMGNIASKVIKQEEEDPDLIIKQPGFGVGQPRFSGPPTKTEEYDDDDIIKQIQDKYKEEKKKKNLKKSSAFSNNEPRLLSIKQNNPGPGAYHDNEEDHWNKRTYNILFADI